MFNKKEIQEIAEKLEETKQEFSKKLEEQTIAIKEISSSLESIKDNNLAASETITAELEQLSALKYNFEKILNKLNSISKSLELTAASAVKEVADEEINSIRSSAKKFKEEEEKIKETLSRINEINMEISKFITISQQIKLVDFTLQKHQEDIHDYEQEHARLLDENERLKLIMARMKRNR